jgi:hypothetical protein
MKFLTEAFKEHLKFWMNPRKNWGWMLFEIACIIVLCFILNEIF